MIVALMMVAAVMVMMVKSMLTQKRLASKSYQRKFLTLQITCSSNEIALGCSLTKA